MVVAGPGTGKTQMVAMRIAEILRRTQLDARNILALTFTDTAVSALKSRLVELIGPDGYQVTVTTFHGFAAEVIDQFRWVFGRQQAVRQLSELERFQILERLIDRNLHLVLLRPPRYSD